MVNNEDAHLDLVFAALSDATRRRVLAQLAQPGAHTFTVSELAQPHGMSLPGFMKHLAVLEAAGLIARLKEGRVVRCELDAAPMQAASAWIAHYERFWTDQLDALGRYLHHQEEVNPSWTTPPSKTPKSTSSASTASPPTKSGAPGRTRKR